MNTTQLKLEEVSSVQGVIDPLPMWDGTLAEFLNVNRDLLSPEEVTTITALTVGATFESGGGGEPRWRLTRVA